MKTQPSVVASLVIVLSLVAGSAAAQSWDSRLEIGGHLSALRIGEVGNLNAGIGGRVSYDLFRWFAVEGEVNYFPKDRIDANMGSASLGLQTRYSRRRVEGFVGPRIGWRNERFGVFGKVRPGFAHLTNTGMSCIGEMCALALFMRPEYKTEFALDLGGIVEFYPTSRTIARFDLGTTAIRNRSRGVPPCRGTDCTTQNLSTSLGMGFRF
jgi:hypothetical protein